ncbi:hypothetical protein CN153_15375 [Sinorhizobium meliloti]|nr:hypothetical protein CN238_01760 [Sinorhizobium meliloti]RVG89335.1 hypothetical protein CN219_02535 [Sinorhizobium meliloti]RVH31211.1 hypothetical protein CN211_21535 [Sinorhizobium meliloti]RVH34621.1 hypothetical protein CN214_05940 [Sinorhizobium meliloti]RVH99092.1 hypothetical protein CN199_01980 [Sinorhizobium meliloti]
MRGIRRIVGRVMACLAAFAALCPAVALAVPAPAGALIESQAVVSYFNTELGIYESVSTNVVVTRVNSVKAIEVVSDQTVFMAPASVGQFAFFIRNTGNAPLSPSATLEQVAGHHANLVDIRAVIDQNRNGTADPGEWELTPDMAIELPVGGELPVIVQFATPASSHDGQLAALRLSAKDGSVADAATGTVIMSSTGLVLEKSATENEVQAGGKLRYGLRLRNNGANAVAAYAQLDGSSILIDGAAASGILVRDARPLNTRVVNAESAAGFVGLYHVAGQPTHTYVTTLPQDPSAVDAVAFFRAGDYPGGFSANLAFEVAVAGNAQEGFILNEASTWQQSGEDLVEVRSNLVRTPVEGGEAALTYAAPDGRPISTAALNSNVRLHLSAAACNTTPGADSVRIRIATDPEADLETAVATETGPNTGLFTTALIPIQRVLPVVQGDSVVSGDRNTKVSASATCGGQTVSAILTVNPGGFVFHSASNVAIPGATVILYDASGAEIERIVSDADGFYVVSAAQNAGAYRIEVLPPEGFSFPSDRKVFPALGRNVEGSSAFGEVSVSIGSASRADGDESVSIGLANNARLVGFEGNDRIKGGQTSVSLGAFNQSPGIEAIAIGARNEANADRSIAIGSSAKTKAADPAQADGGARDAVAIGTDALANDDRSISIGWNSSTSLNDSISIGTRATSGSAGDIMIGTVSGTGSTSGQNNVALGVAASQKVKGSSNIAIGDSAGGYREGDNNVAIGTNAGIQFSESEHETAVRADLVVSDAVSIGNEALASADEAIAIGTGAVASGLKSISIGVGNTVSGASSGAIGDPTDITGTGSYSLGNDNTIAADNAGTFGNDNTLADAADGSRVIGNGNNIDVSDAFVLGNGADVTEVGGVALGSGSVFGYGCRRGGLCAGRGLDGRPKRHRGDAEHARRGRRRQSGRRNRRLPPDHRCRRRHGRLRCRQRGPAQIGRDDRQDRLEAHDGQRQHRRHRAGRRVGPQRRRRQYRDQQSDLEQRREHQSGR